MKIVKKEIVLCAECGNYKGIVIEMFNGILPVHCACGLKEEKVKYGGWRSPCMICPNGDKFFWTPVSSHKEEDGEIWNIPYYHPVDPLNKIKVK